MVDLMNLKSHDFDVATIAEIDLPEMSLFILDFIHLFENGT